MSAVRKIENGKTSFYVQPTWEATSFQMIIIEGENAWHANVTERQLKALADERQKNVDAYYNDIKDSINNDKPNITFDIKKNGSTSQFLIYLKVGTSKINFFINDLSKVDYQTCIFDLIDAVNSKNLELVKMLQKSEQEKQAAYNDKEACEKKLQEFTELKTNWEKELYSNFLLLLNEKKKRISFLTGMLKSGKSGSEVDIDVMSKEIVSDSESEKEYETDDEDSTQKMDVDVQPSTSAQSDLFKPDTPPPLLLPKRVKSNTQTEIVVPVKVAAPSVKNLVKQKTPEPDVAEEENTLTFSTQDLIDRM